MAKDMGTPVTPTLEGQDCLNAVQDRLGLPSKTAALDWCLRLAERKTREHRTPTAEELLEQMVS